MTTFVFFLPKTEDPCSRLILHQPFLRAYFTDYYNSSIFLIILYLLASSPKPINTLQVSYLCKIIVSSEYCFLLWHHFFSFVYDELEVHISCFYILSSSLPFNPLQSGIHFYASLKQPWQRS